MSLKEPTDFVWDDRLAEADRGLVGDLNMSLGRLSGLRAVEINVSGKFTRSKIAWKLATYQHVLAASARSADGWRGCRLE